MAAIKKMPRPNDAVEPLLKGVRPKRLLEIINPSDKYTMETDDLPAAAAAIIICSDGAYGLHAQDDSWNMPKFLFGGNVIQWFKAEFDLDLGDFTCSPDGCDRMAAALDTVIIGTFTEREALQKSLLQFDDAAAKKQALAIWHDQERSSMNDIGAVCVENAKRLRAFAEKKRNEKAIGSV